MQINVRDFIYENIKQYNGNDSFLKGPSNKTQKLRKICLKLLEKERKNNGILDIDTKTISSATSHKPGYIKKDLEIIFGLQTDYPLKRAIKPFGGRRVAQMACEQNGKSIDKKVLEIFQKYRKTHNDGVFGAYNKDILKYRKSKILSGLPDNYARGRIIGDYRRIALYGIHKLIEQKQNDLDQNLKGDMLGELIQLREEVSDQINALKNIQQMALDYGFDISKPAQNAQEAIQRTYFAFLACIKEQDGAAMSLGAVSSFFDIYIQKDIEKGEITEEFAQELIDQFTIKLRLIRQLRPKEYNELFAGDPTWTTESIGGAFEGGKHKVTKTSFRFLQSLYNLGASPEPNITILWSKHLPINFKKFCAKVSIDTSSIQYENDDLMNQTNNFDDSGIACCVSYTKLGKSMQFFGARCNIAKALLYSINEGKDEIMKDTIINGIPKLKNNIILNYDEVIENYKNILEKLAKEYVDTMNIIHYMHDKYYYEKSQMALIDTYVERTMAFGIAGLSVAVDSLSAIKYAKVECIRNKDGIAEKFKITGKYPQFGNDDDNVDEIAKRITKTFIQELRKNKIYRNAIPTLSVLTITSNVIYGHHTGSTPDGRKLGQPFAPGANPMHGRDTKGAIASLNSVSKINYEDCKDGISNTFSVVPQTLGADELERVQNLVQLLDGYFENKGQHLNINVLNKKTLEDAIEHPEKYPQLTIRVSGYAVNFIKLSPEQQKEVIARTFHKEI